MVATFRCFGVRQLAAAFLQASLLAALRLMDSTQRGGTRASSRGVKRQQAAALQSYPKYPWDQPRTRPRHARDLSSFA